MFLKHHLAPLSLALALIFIDGCTNYRYDVTTPDGGALAVAKDQDLIVPADPVRLRLRQVESRCVLIVENPTADAVTLDGAGSTIVDPSGQSRTIGTQLIAAGSYIKLILPPLRANDPNGPRVTFGFGVLANASTDAGVDSNGERKATYLDTTENGQDYWEWPDEGTIRVILSLKVKDQTTKHEVTIRKTKI